MRLKGWHRCGKNCTLLKNNFSIKDRNMEYKMLQQKKLKKRIKALEVAKQWEALKPMDEDQLHHFVNIVLGVDCPRRGVVESHACPFDYLKRVFFEDEGGDTVVWASRGGGKTFMGAVATLLDLVFKPGVQVRILGGSLEQSSKMYGYLLKMIEKPMFAPLMLKKPTKKRIELVTGSAVEILPQSEKAVRGQRVHKLRCDEVELFDKGVWDAAQLITRSDFCGDTYVRGSVEALSTMHQPFGLMHELVTKFDKDDKQTKVLRWGALDVIERCDERYACEGCGLWADCKGGAKEANGFVPVEDLLMQRLRTSCETWASEMMCHQPRRSDCVYPSFDCGVGGKHIRKVDVASVANSEASVIVGGMDFGLRSPTVMLWARVFFDEQDRQCVHVFDELIETDRTLERMIDLFETRNWPNVKWVGVDPAGNQRNSQTGLTDVQVLKQRGYKIRSRRSLISQGVECVRRHFDRETLFVDPRCEKLVQALASYHFDLKNLAQDSPVKDGPDHACDALRYLLINLDQAGAGMRWSAY